MNALPPSRRPRLTDEQEDALLRFEDAWEQSGAPNRTEFVPEDAGTEFALELVHIDIERRIRASLPIDVPGYLHEFPDLAAHSEELHRAAQRSNLEETIPRLGDRGDVSREPGSVTFEAHCTRLRPHAHGGLGEVLQADDPLLGRRIAVKVLKARWAANPRARRDFLQEAEVTSRLEHPGIVPVHGLGRTTDGRPCYSMRFVEGRTLHEAIRQFHRSEPAEPVKRGLEFRQLLSRFVAVCNTVAYAHSRGVLHRDLKPANIMLGPFGETLVLDWGLSKDAGIGTQASQDSGDQTLMGEVRGTLAYLSPEQAVGDPAGIGPTTDVFGLGATLYALLTGQPPYRGSELGETLNRAKAADFIPPRRLNRHVPAALDAICCKAMALRPADRYQSPLELAADLENWLADERVTAYHEPWLVGVRRGLRRRRTLVAVLTALAIVVPVGTGVGSWLIAREKGRTDTERQTARLKEESATQITSYLEDVFATADPFGVDAPGFRAASPEATTRLMLDRGAQLVRAHLHDQPLARAHLLDAMGNAYRNLGDWDTAEPMVTEALALRTELLGPDDEQTLASMQSLARLKQDRGDYDEAEQLYRQLLELHMVRHGAESLPVARVKFFLGWMIFHRPLDGPVFDATRLAESEQMLRDSLTVRRKHLGEDHPDLGFTYVGLAAVKQCQVGDLNKLMALGLIGKARECFARSPEYAEIGQMFGTLVQAETARQRERDFAKAEPLYHEVLATSKRILGNQHPLIVLQLGNLAGFYRAWGKMDEAFRMGREAMAIVRTMPMRAAPIIIDVLREGGDIFRQQGDLAQARQIYEEALQYAHERPKPNADRIKLLESRLAELKATPPKN